MGTQERFDPLYRHTLEEMLAGKQLTLPTNVGNDPSTGKSRTEARARREIRKIRYQLEQENEKRPLTEMKIQGLIEACEEAKKKPSVVTAEREMATA